MTENETEKLLEFVAQKLVSLGEVSRPYTIVPHTHQGYNSRVCVLSSGSKEFVVHLTKPFGHYFTDKTWEKLLAVSLFLREEAILPISRIIFAEPREDFIVSVQEKLPGDIAGTVAITDHRVIYTWLQNKVVLMPQILNMLAVIHTKPVSGYGLPVTKNGILTGTSVAWQEFLRERVQCWLGAIKSGESAWTLEASLFREIETYAEQFHFALPLSVGGLVHGDLGNPSNILAENGKVTGLIDWEFALIGDPAWEFCDEGWAETVRETGLKDYFQARHIDTEEEREDFLNRITLLRPIQCLMWLYVHRNDEDPVIFDTCVELLKKDLAEANQVE